MNGSGARGASAAIRRACGSANAQSCQSERHREHKRAHAHRPRARARVERRRAPEAQARMPRAGERHRYNILAGWLNVSHLAD